MKTKMIRIGLVFACHYQGFPPGGSQPTIEIFLKGAQARPFDVWLFGLTTSRDEQVGKVSKRIIYGREYPFVPLFYLDVKRYKDRKPLIPVRVQAFVSYLRFQSLIKALGFDLLYLHAPETVPLLWWKNQPVLYHFHGPDETAAEYSRYQFIRTRPFRYFYNIGIQSILEKADQFIIIDPETYDRYRRRAPHRVDRFHLYPTAIDVEQFRPLPNFDRAATHQGFRLPQEGKMVLFVGRLSWRKGVNLVVKAFSLVAAQDPSAFLAIAGIGEDRAELEAVVHQLNLDKRVFFLGQVPHLPSPNLPRLFNCADVLVVASLQESLALVITEALACGTPVVSTRVGIAPTVVRNGITGYLVESREPREIADRILQVIRDGAFNRDCCVAIAKPYGETSKPICDVIEQLCWGSEKAIGDSQSRNSRAAVLP